MVITHKLYKSNITLQSENMSNSFIINPQIATENIFPFLDYDWSFFLFSAHGWRQKKKNAPTHGNIFSFHYLKYYHLSYKDALFSKHFTN